MTELSFPDSLRYIGNYCFAVSSCKFLKIGRNVEFIGHCIVGANEVIEKIVVDRKNLNFAHDDLYNLYSKNYSVLYQVNAATEHYTTPQTVKLIKAQAFNSIPIKTVIITQNCVFEDKAFFSLTNLENVTFFGNIQPLDVVFFNYPSLKSIKYYSDEPVFTDIFYTKEKENISVSCCFDYNGNFSGIVPIQEFACINPIIKSCIVNHYHRLDYIYVFIPILIE